MAETEAAHPARRAVAAWPGRAARALEQGDVRFGMWVFVGAMVMLIAVRVVWRAPVSILVLGAILGSLNALVAMGLVLVYRANRIINFAQGDLGAVAAVLSVSLIVGEGWPFFPAVLAGLVAALMIGAVVEFFVIRRFTASPRLILTVVTIALAAVLQFVQLVLPRVFGYDTAPQDFPVPFEFSFEWFPVVYRTSHLMVLIAVPLVVIGLAAFFRLTRAGIAVRAAAERADRAALLGVPVKRIGTLVWVLASGLSAVGVLLRAPIGGVPIGTVLGPGLLLRALAAAVIARMENLWVAAGTAVALGVLEQAIFWDTQRTLVADGVLFFVILGALVLQKRKESRADDSGAASWSAVKEVRPVPPELRGVPEVRWGMPALAGLGLVLLLVLPLTWDGSRVFLFSIGLIFAMVGVSLVVLTGWAGQISLGQMAFVAIGGAVAGKMALNGHHFFVTLLVAGLVGAAVATLIGIPALRIRGPFLAVATLAFALATGAFFLNSEFFPWLVPEGRVMRPVLFGKFNLESEHTYYYVMVVLLGVMLVSARSLRTSRTGRTLIAVRDNSRAAQSYGVSPVRAQLTAFAVSGFFAAVAGGAFVYHQHELTATIREVPESIKVFSMVVIGGLGSLPGALLGAAWLTFINYSPLTKFNAVQLLGSGLGVLAILLFLPGGLGGLLYDLRDGVLRRIARRRGIVVPSLLADARTADDADHAMQDAAGGGRGDGPAPPVPPDGAGESEERDLPMLVEAK